MLKKRIFTTARRIAGKFYSDTITFYRRKGDRTASGGTKSKFPDDWEAVATVACRVEVDNRSQRESQTGGQVQSVTYYNVFTASTPGVDGGCKGTVTASRFNQDLVGLVLDVTAAPQDSFGVELVIEAVAR